MIQRGLGGDIKCCGLELGQPGFSFSQLKEQMGGLIEPPSLHLLAGDKLVLQPDDPVQGSVQDVFFWHNDLITQPQPLTAWGFQLLQCPQPNARCFL